MEEPNPIPDKLIKKRDEIHALLNDMIMELRFRGCDDHHTLIQRGRELCKWLKKTPS